MNSADIIPEKHNPKAFVFHERYHETSDWRNLVHDLLEDIIFTGIDAACEKLVDKKLSTSEISICLSSKKEPNVRRLSNGLYMPFSRSMTEYSKACFDLCVVYGFGPFDIRFLFEEDLENLEYLFFAAEENTELSGTNENPDDTSEAEENQTDKSQNTDNSDKTEQRTNESEKTSGEEKDPGKENEAGHNADNLLDLNGTVNKFFGKDSLPEIKIGVNKDHLDEELDLLLDQELDEDDEDEDFDISDKRVDCLFDEVSGWDEVIEKFGQQKNNQAVLIAKKMRKNDIPEPDGINLKLVYNGSDDNTLTGRLLTGRVLAEAALYWDVMNLVWLTKEQQPCKFVLQQLGYTSIDLNEIKCRKILKARQNAILGALQGEGV